MSFAMKDIICGKLFEIAEVREIRDACCCVICKICSCKGNRYAVIKGILRERGGPEIGSIEAGRLADFVLCGDDLSPHAVYIGGKGVSSHCL